MDYFREQNTVVDIQANRIERQINIDPWASADLDLQARKLWSLSRRSGLIAGKCFEFWTLKLDQQDLGLTERREFYELGFLAALPILTAGVRDPRVMVRVNALKVAAMLGSHDPRGIALSLLAISDPKSKVRKIAARNLSFLKTIGREFARPISLLIDHSIAEVRVQGIRAFEKLPFEALNRGLKDRLLQQLDSAMGDRCVSVRRAACRAFRINVEEAPGACKTLVAKSIDPSPTVRQVAAEELGGLITRNKDIAKRNTQIRQALLQALGDDLAVATVARRFVGLESEEDWNLIRTNITSGPRDWQLRSLAVLIQRPLRCRERYESLNFVETHLCGSDLELQHRAFYVLRGTPDLTRRAVALYLRAMTTCGKRLREQLFRDLEYAISQAGESRAFALAISAALQGLVGELLQRSAEQQYSDFDSEALNNCQLRLSELLSDFTKHRPCQAKPTCEGREGREPAIANNRPNFGDFEIDLWSMLGPINADQAYPDYKPDLGNKATNRPRHPQIERPSIRARSAPPRQRGLGRNTGGAALARQA